MKRLVLLAALALSPLARSNPDPVAAKAAEDQALLKIVAEVKAQQATMAENQAKIDERLTAMAEAIRVARIYSSRSGK